MNVALILGVAIGLSAPTLKDPPKKVSGVVGEWVLDSVTMRGKDCALMTKGARIDITADGRWINDSDRPDPKDGPTAYVLDPKADPQAIDVGASRGINSLSPLRGIYKCKGDTLIICFSVLSNERPKSFDPPDDDSLVLHLVLKRVPKKK
jgi:uncharacterized protein (TIGR03067 family)